MSVLDTHHTPKISFLLVPKKETDSKPDTHENNILKLNDTSVMHMLAKGRIKINRLTNLALCLKFQRILKVVQLSKEFG